MGPVPGLHSDGSILIGTKGSSERKKGPRAQKTSPARLWYVTGTVGKLPCWQSGDLETLQHFLIIEDASLFGPFSRLKGDLTAALSGSNNPMPSCQG